MADDKALEAFFEALSQRTGTPPIGPDEAAAVLDLARDVAHGSERRFAPIAAYAVGLSAGLSRAPLDPRSRARRVREVAEAARDLGREDKNNREDTTDREDDRKESGRG